MLRMSLRKRFIDIKDQEDLVTFDVSFESKCHKKV